MAIRVAASLRVADHVAHGRRTAGEIAAFVDVDGDALDRVMRHLVTAGVLNVDHGGYGLTDVGERLRDDHPSGARSVLDIDGALGRAELASVHLCEAVRSGEPCFPLLYGLSFWDDLASDTARQESYDKQMGSDVSRWAVDISGAFDWGSLDHVVDVGGGNGSLLAALLWQFPALRGTVVDQPATAGAALAALAAGGLEDRSEVVAGSFFDPLPAGADGYILSAILHNWDNAAATTILRRCAEAAGENGAVFVIEKTGVDGESPRTDMDLRVLAFFGGKERGVTEITALADDAQLQVVAVHPAGDLSIIELTPDVPSLVNQPEVG